MASFTIGKYIPYNSWVHRLDPRLKIFGIIALMVCVFLPFETWAMRFTMVGVMFLLAAILLWCTRIRIGQILASLRGLWFMVIFLLLIYILIPNSEPVLGEAWNLNGWVVYWDSFAEAGRIFARLLVMVMLTMVLTASTKPLDLTYALEWYMTPLKAIRFPAAEIAMTISIALRFIPTLLEDASRVMKAQASRGVDFERGRIIQRITGLTSLIIPLFASSFMRSEELANAMECRGYDPRAKRTRYRKLKWHWVSDTVSLLVACGLMAFYIYASVTSLNFYTLLGIAVL